LTNSLSCSCFLLLLLASKHLHASDPLPDVDLGHIRRQQTRVLLASEYEVSTNSPSCVLSCSSSPLMFLAPPSECQHICVAGGDGALAA
jgi:hypothetical protein